jgi:hypothetical protein
MDNSEEMEIETANSAVATVKNLKVVDARTYEIMGNGVLLLRKAKKFFSDRAKPRIDEARKLVENLRRDLDADLKPIEEAQEYGDAELARWDTEQRKVAEAEQARLQAEQRKRDEEERLQLAGLAEQAGEKQLAEEIISAPNTEPIIVVPKATPKVEGLSFREDWLFEIQYPQMIPPLYHRLQANPKGEWSCKCIQDIGAEVKRLKSETRIPGIRVYMKKTPVGRG